MARTRWFEPLFTFLRDQPAETERVTLAVRELATLAVQPVPRTVRLRSYWWNRQPGTMGPRLAAIGWRVVHAWRLGEDLTITFARVSPDTAG